MKTQMFLKGAMVAIVLFVGAALFAGTSGVKCGRSVWGGNRGDHGYDDVRSVGFGNDQQSGPFFNVGNPGGIGCQGDCACRIQCCR